MQLLAAIGNERVAKLLSDRTKRDAVDDGAVARLEAYPQMRLSPLVGIDELVCRQRQHDFRIAAAKGTCAVERRCKLGRHGARGDRAVDVELVDVARLGNVARQGMLEIGAKFGELFLAQG